MTGPDARGDAGEADGASDVAGDTSPGADVDAGPDLIADAPPADMTALGPPAMLILTGTATGQDPEDGAEVSCRFDGTFIDIVVGDDGWTAVASGEVYRTIARDGLPLELQAFVGGPATHRAGSQGGLPGLAADLRRHLGAWPRRPVRVVSVT